MLKVNVNTSLSVALTACLLLLTGCGEDSQNSTTTEPQAAASSSWMLSALPEGALPVAQAKADAKEGDTITLVGRIGGRSEPITASSGLFVVMDPAIPSCADNPEDKCAKPWDYCCETQETITANAATIQLRDAEGNPVTLAEGDLEPLSQVTVVGTVAPRPNNDTLIVYATGLYVQPAQH